MDVTLLFADVLVESPELYRFLDAGAALLGVPLTRISEEKTPWELFREEGAIGNSAHPICSFMLKREPLDRWMRRNTLELDTILYVGFDWTELHRLEKLRTKRPNWHIEAPMTEMPLWDKCKMIEEANKLGLPSMLKDRRGGVTRNLSLVELANRIESGEQFSRQDWGGCGCGATYEQK